VRYCSSSSAVDAQSMVIDMHIGLYDVQASVLLVQLLELLIQVVLFSGDKQL
jgi:hypothetical protein